MIIVQECYTNALKIFNFNLHLVQSFPGIKSSIPSPLPLFPNCTGQHLIWNGANQDSLIQFSLVDSSSELYNNLLPTDTSKLLFAVSSPTSLLVISETLEEPTLTFKSTGTSADHHILSELFPFLTTPTSLSLFPSSLHCLITGSGPLTSTSRGACLGIFTFSGSLSLTGTYFLPSSLGTSIGSSSLPSGSSLLLTVSSSLLLCTVSAFEGTVEVQRRLDLGGPLGRALWSRGGRAIVAGHKEVLEVEAY